MQLRAIWLRLTVTLALLVISGPVWNCWTFDGVHTRFWLLDPATVNLRELMAYAYEPETRYHEEENIRLGNSWSQDNTAPNIAQRNISEWRKTLNGTPLSKDIDLILNAFPPDAYFAKKYRSDNTFMRALNQPGNVELLQYLNFAKEAEDLLNSGDVWSTDDTTSAKIPLLIEKGQQQLSKTQNSFARQRYAFMLVKLGSYIRSNPNAADLYEKHLKTANSWVREVAPFYIADCVPDSLQRNLWFARAWRSDPEQRIEIERRYRNRLAEQTLPLATNNQERADILLIPALVYPGPALDKLQQIYQFEPDHAQLSLLIAREVNKLEEWIMAPQISALDGVHAEIPYTAVQPDKKIQYEKDLKHLHDTRLFVQKILQDAKRPDPAFWNLTAAHLAFLEHDFESARAFAAAGKAVKNSPKAQQIQLQLIDLLAAIGNSPRMTDELETQSIQLLNTIGHANDALLDYDYLYANVNLLLSNLISRQGDKAKGALMLSQCNNLWDSYASNSMKTCYDKLLDTGTPADFDRAIDILTHPKSPLEKWLVAHPFEPGDSYYMEWDTLQCVYRQADYGTGKKEKHWDIATFQRFKSMYYVRRDQLDSAILSLPKEPGYWDSYYLFRNPFSVELEVPGLELSRRDTSNLFDKKSCLEKILELEQDAKQHPERAQGDYFLIGNAYYNMSNPGRGWFLLHSAYKGWGSYQDLNNGNWKIAPKENARWTANEPASNQEHFPVSHWAFTAVGLAGLAGFAGLRRNKRLLFVLPVCLIFLGSPSCNKGIQPAANSSAVRDIDDYKQVFFGAARAKFWYKKGMDLNPSSDLGIVCTYMMGKCDNAWNEYQFGEDDNNSGKDFEPAPNPYLAKIKGSKYNYAVSCKDFERFLKDL